VISSIVLKEGDKEVPPLLGLPTVLPSLSPPAVGEGVVQKECKELG
jgi:hypothetical protein